MTEEKTTKRFETYLVINWKSGNVRLAKRKPKDLTPLEVPIHVRLDLVIPNFKEIKAEGTIEISEIKAGDIILEGI